MENLNIEPACQNPSHLVLLGNMCISTHWVTPPVELDAPPTASQPCDGDPSEDIMMASLIQDPEPEEELDDTQCGGGY